MFSKQHSVIIILFNLSQSVFFTFLELRMSLSHCSRRIFTVAAVYLEANLCQHWLAIMSFCSFKLSMNSNDDIKMS